MKSNRQNQIEKSLTTTFVHKENSNQVVVKNSENYGVILSTLGRQGSPKILDNLIMKLQELNKNYFIVLLSEIFPQKLKLFNDQIDT